MVYKLVVEANNTELPGVYMFYEDARKAQIAWDKENSPYYTRIIIVE